MDYPEAVRRLFFNPECVGPLLVRSTERLCRGEAGSDTAGVRILVEAAVQEDQVVRLAFRARGCPYLLAACSRAMVLLAPGPVGALAAFEPAGLMGELGIPTEKLGSLLILQDALRNCFRDWDTTQPAGAR